MFDLCQMLFLSFFVKKEGGDAYEKERKMSLFHNYAVIYCNICVNRFIIYKIKGI